MAHLDVEALLDAAANGDSGPKGQNGKSETLLNGHGSTNADDADKYANGKSHSNGGRSPDENGRSRHRTRSRSPEREEDRERDRRRRDHRSHSPRSEAGSHKSSRRRSRSRDREPRAGRNSRRRNRGRGGGGRGGDDVMDGDHYSSRNGRSRSRSPNRYYRPRDSRRDRDDDRGGRRRDDRDSDRRRRDRSPHSRDTSMPPLTEDERDRRTVFVQQLAARLRTRELKDFFEKAGPVAEAQIVKDRVSNRSKGVGYVEFRSEESVTAALQLTGQKLLGIPVIVQMTEAEKNRQVRSTAEATSNGNSTGVPFHRLYVGNIHFSITESDLRNVFEPFGELEFVQLQKDDTGRSRGYGFVQFRDSDQAREALEKMNGFDLAGRPIRVGLGNDKFTPESTANLMKGFQGRDQQQQHQGSAFSGSGGRGQNASNFDRAGGRDNDKGSGAGALDDTDVAGVNFNNYSRDALMRKLARADDSSANGTGGGSTSAAADEQQRPILKPRTEAKPLPVNVNMASRCVVLHNMFDTSEEEGEEWIKELEDDVRQEAEEKYGHVVHVALDPNSIGDIYLKFDKVQGGENAIKGLNGRYFGGRMITAAPVVDAVYSSLFSRTKAI
ncbi:RNA splicing factor [Grosmannia clavigera kw1407]|uniref:RNA splicing factor n=1 Tax=Grosmannia clavigera (strain kw1407 / UAMH 11150) TaxID=655863 RepID=F0XA64_GROCL|nr:RNA splicing factor [Grosmannia clavigera kw1407]EFX05928.1 RNA splicing factor [Grosmannia clavigera kw1407]